MSDAKLPDSSNLAAWEKAAAKSAPDGDVSALNWVTPEGITAVAIPLIAGLVAFSMHRMRKHLAAAESGH